MVQYLMFRSILYLYSCGGKFANVWNRAEILKWK